jgi:hypothetical protein
VKKRRTAASFFAIAGNNFIKYLQQLLSWYLRDRDWWKQAPPERVLRVMAERMLSLAFGLLVTAGATMLYASTGEFPAAKTVAVTMALLSFIALLFSAHRLGESFVLARVPGDPGQVSRRTRIVLAFAVMAAVCVWAWCGYAVTQGQLWSIERHREPITFTVIGGLLMFASTYLLATLARAWVVALSSASAHDRIRQKVYGRSWVWLKNFGE